MRISVIFAIFIFLSFSGCDNGTVKNQYPDENNISGTDTDQMESKDSVDSGPDTDEIDDRDTGDTGNSGDSGNTGNTGIDTDGMDDTDAGNTGDSGNTGNTDHTAVFQLGPYFVLTNEYSDGDSGAPRDFKVYEPQGATGSIPVIHFLHGFQLKLDYYDDVLIHLASHGFIVVSSQSTHSILGGDTTTVEAGEVADFITWMKTDLSGRLSVIPDFTKFGVSGHSRGGKVTNRMLNANPDLAIAFFGLDPVDSAPPTGGDPESLTDTVLFTGQSMFLGTEKGPNGFQACAPAGENSVAFYNGYPSPSRHIIAAGVGHMDMVDELDLSACGITCSVCDGSGDSTLNASFRSYNGALMAAFFSYTLKDLSVYEALLSDTMSHPFINTLAEHK